MSVARIRDRQLLATAGAVVTHSMFWIMLAALLSLAASPTFAADAQVSRFVWDEVSVTVRLQDNGLVRVREHDTVRFYGGPFRQGYREIPLAAIDGISQVTVTEVGDGPARQYRSVRPGSYSRNDPFTYTFQQVGTVMRIEWSFPPTTSASRAWVIDYTASGVVRVYDDAQPPYEEIWWIGVDRELTRDAPVIRATLLFILPRPVDPAATVAQSNGRPFGGEDGLVWFWTAENLGAGETLQASLKFPPLIGASKPTWQDTVDRRVARETPANLVFLGLALLTAVGGSVGLLAAWWTKGRDPLPGPIPLRLTEPPDDTPPGVVGALLDEQVAQREYAATLIDLARRGVVRLTTLARPDVNSRRLMLTLLQPDAPMAPYERALLSAFFVKSWWKRAKVHLPLDDPAAMREALNEVDHLLYGELVQRGYFTRKPPGTREGWRYAGIALWVVAVGVLLVGMVAVSAIIWPLLASAALIALGAAVFVLSWHMPQKTRAGAEAAARWRAFQSYMEAVERVDALRSGQNGFERYLPYAVAFGIEGPWIDAFARAQTTSAPPWYDLVNLNGNWMSSAVRSGARVPLSAPGITDLSALQDVSSLAGSSFQASSDTLVDLFNEMGEAFNPENALRGSAVSGTAISGSDIALRIGISIIGAALTGGKGSGGGGGGFS